MSALGKEQSVCGGEHTPEHTCVQHPALRLGTQNRFLHLNQARNFRTRYSLRNTSFGTACRIHKLSLKEPCARLTLQLQLQAAVGEAQLGGEALEGKLLILMPVRHLQRLQRPVQVPARRKSAFLQSGAKEHAAKSRQMRLRRRNAQACRSVRRRLHPALTASGCAWTG